MQRRELAVLRLGVFGLVLLLGACDKGEAQPTADARPTAETKVADAKAPDAKAPDIGIPDPFEKTTAEPVADTAVPPEPPPAVATPTAGGAPTGPVFQPFDMGLPPLEDMPDDDEEPELELDLTYETIGGVHVSMSAAEVLAKLGKPQKRSKVIMQGATGDHAQTWHYEGLEIIMTAQTRKGAQTVAYLAATAECKLPASWGLAIGSTRAEVEKVYAKGLVPDLSSPDHLTAGSPYSGVSFDFQDGKVTGISIGGGE